MRFVNNPFGEDLMDIYEESEADRIGTRIRTIRKARGMSQAELGEKVGLNADRIQKYENGARKPKADMLKKIVEYLTHYKGVEPKYIPKPLPSSNLSDSIDEWEINFINGIELDNLYDLINGANYMGINSLVDLASAKIASLMKDKTVEEMRIMLNTECDLSEEELKKLEELKL